MADAVDPHTLFAAIALARDVSPATVAAELNARMANEKIPFATLVTENRGALDAYAQAQASARAEAAAEAEASGSVTPAAPAPALRVVTRRAKAAQADGSASAQQPQPPVKQRSLRETLDLVGFEIAKILDQIDPQVGMDFSYVPGLAGSEYQGWIVHATLLEIQETDEGPALMLDEETGRIATTKATPDFKLDPSNLGAGLDHVITNLIEMAQGGGQE